MSEIRKIAAIMVADVVGYSRLAGADEDRTLSRLRALRIDLIDPAVAAHHGRVVKRTGDGLIAEFRSVVEAVRSAIAMPPPIRGKGGARRLWRASASSRRFVPEGQAARTTGPAGRRSTDPG
jgi:class 3 adenylate cyclase